MGMYDTFNGIQLKVGDCVLDNFKIGDKVPIPDGVYLAPDGVVVVVGGKLAYTSDHVFSKWGRALDTYKLLEPVNPFAQAMNDILATRSTFEMTYNKSLRHEHEDLKTVLDKTLEVLETYVKER